MTVTKPWGSYEVLRAGPAYKVKKIVVDPGHKLSLQRHLHRDEVWVVTSGRADVNSGTSTLLSVTVGMPGDSFRVPAKEWHRLGNSSRIPLVVIEVQTGTCDEDDIERAADDYGRTT